MRRGIDRAVMELSALAICKSHQPFAAGEGSLTAQSHFQVAEVNYMCEIFKVLNCVGKVMLPLNLLRKALAV